MMMYSVLIEQYMRDYGDVRVRAVKAGHVTESVYFMKKSEDLVDKLKQYLAECDHQHQALLNKIAGYQVIVSKLYDFMDEHDFTYLAERNALNWGLSLLFPSVSKSITKLVYDVHYLKKTINEMDED